MDWQRLHAKIDHGADFVITQLFFQNSHYFECRDFLAKRGVAVPIVPGILPIISASQVKRFVALCGAAMPRPLLEELERRCDDDRAVAEFGVEYATTQCDELLREGAPGLHFYTLNKAASTTGGPEQPRSQEHPSPRGRHRLSGARPRPVSLAVSGFSTTYI